MKIKTFEEVATWQLCCGCGGCAYMHPGQIQMIDVPEYGRRPHMQSEPAAGPVEPAMEMCPGIQLTRPAIPDEMISMKKVCQAWGLMSQIWEGYAADPQIRYEGSSGGVSTALSLYAIEKLGMQGVLHTRYRGGAPYLNQTVFSTCREDLLAGAASRYSPASPCDSLHLIEQSEKPCVFIGKPCDVAAVAKICRLRPELGEKIGLTIAFFCAGTPSTQGTLEMLRRMGVVDPAQALSLRYRGQGWPGMAAVVYQDDHGAIQQRQLTYEQSWGEILQKYRQWRCYICPDHIGEYADIAVADAWHRSISDYQPGLSVILGRTKRGLEIVHRAQSDGYLSLQETDPSVLEQCMPWQVSLRGHLWGRLLMLRILRVPIPKYKGFSLFMFWLRLPFLEKINSIVSTVKRIFVKELKRPRDMNG